MSSSWPSDACALHPETKLRIGPSTLSTIIIVLCFLLLLGQSALNVQRARMDKEGRMFNTGCMIIQIGFFWMYFLHYTRCRPWTGWFLYVFISTLAVMLFALIVPPPPSQKDDFLGIRMTGVGESPIFIIPSSTDGVSPPSTGEITPIKQ